MSEALHFVSKAHCYRRLVADARSTCSNGCRYCYMRRYDSSRSGTVIDVNKVRRQLGSRSAIGKYMRKYRVVRIGAFGDLPPGDNLAHTRMLELMTLLNSYGYKYVVVTKSAHSVDDLMLDTIAHHGCVLSVSCGFYRASISRLFENNNLISPSSRRSLIVRAIKRGVTTILRLNPIHPDYMSEHARVIEWYASVGGQRIIMESIRVLPSWVESMPNVRFSSFVPVIQGGIYNGYITPDRSTQDTMISALVSVARINGITKVTVCGDMELNDRVTYDSGTDCCQATDVFGTPLPPRTIGELEGILDDKCCVS